MVQAILAGRKTQTRRVVKGFDHVKSENLLFSAAVVPKFQFKHKLTNYEWYINCPYGKPGDVLWVRETWARAIGSEQVTTSEKATAVEISPERFIVFKADSKEQTHPEHPEWGKKRWKPSIHMPKDAARIWLRITRVRVERLQSITEQGAISEGIHQTFIADKRSDCAWKNYLNNGHGSLQPVQSFESLWQSINGSDSWKDNPWVWVIEFERIEKPEL